MLSSRRHASRANCTNSPKHSWPESLSDHGSANLCDTVGLMHPLQLPITVIGNSMIMSKMHILKFPYIIIALLSFRRIGEMFLKLASFFHETKLKSLRVPLLIGKSAWPEKKKKVTVFIHHTFFSDLEWIHWDYARMEYKKHKILASLML